MANIGQGLGNIGNVGPGIQSTQGKVILGVIVIAALWALGFSKILFWLVALAMLGLVLVNWPTVKNQLGIA